MLFAEEPQSALPSAAEPLLAEPWKLLVVDDEADVHSVTRMALRNFEFLGRPLEILNAYSAREAREILRSDGNIAMVLLDVVMERPDAGLALVQWIRGELDNQDIRIVLRTGQPGQAPERDVITGYDINDYREKTELTAKRLHTMVVACLRAWRDLRALQRNRRGLDRIIQAMGTLFRLRSMHDLAVGVLEQLTALFYLDEHAAFASTEGIAVHEDQDGVLRVIAATGRYRQAVSEDIGGIIPEDFREYLTGPIDGERVIIKGDTCLALLTTSDGHLHAVLLRGVQGAMEVDETLVRLFLRNIGVAFDNHRLMTEIDATERELIFRLGEAVETRSGETGNHVRRVALMSRFLANQMGYSAEEAEIIYRASPLHDVGKIAIPDLVLNKPGKLDADEWLVMKTHAGIGANLLGGSHLTIVRHAAIIAAQHHERWDGAGYPDGIAGEAIHPYARLVGAVDVLDALLSKRSYKQAWSRDEVVSYFETESGRQFDPAVAAAILRHMDALLLLRSSIDIPGAPLEFDE